MSRIILGVAGGIAAYKACELLRRFTESGHHVTVVPTASALRFVGATTWAALSGHPVHTDVWDDAHRVPHVRLGREADLVVVAPATADLLTRAATGRADDLLTNVLLTTRAPVVYSPAMHTEMWLHPATAANVATLRERGAVVLDPAVGRLTGVDTGPGRLPDPADIFAVAESVLSPEVAVAAARRDLTGLVVAVSAGGTREHLDPVRFLANASSGLMGIALARAAALRGAEVRLVAANITEALPSGCAVTPVGSTAELAIAMQDQAADADIVVMAAAPADYTPAHPSDTKIKKSGHAGLTLELTQTPDVLAAIGRSRRPGQVLVGFAAETAADVDALVELAQAKRLRKGADLLVANDVSGGAVFGRPDTAVLLVDEHGVHGPYVETKDRVAHRIWDVAAGLRPSQ